MIRIFTPDYTYLDAGLFREAYLLGGSLTTSLIPNLTKLKFRIAKLADIQSLSYLLRPRVTEIGIVSTDLTEVGVIAVARLLAAQAPHVSGLTWELDDDTKWSMPVQLHTAISLLSLDSLQRLCFSAKALTLRPIWEVLGSLSNLRDLQAFDNDHCEIPSKIRNLVFDAGSFRQLQRFGASVTGEQAATLLRSGLPPSLKFLRLSINSGHVTECKTVFDLIASVMPQLSSFSIDCYGTSSSVDVQGLGSSTIAWSHLTTLIIIVDAPLDFTDDDVRAIAKALPAVTKLELGPNPTVFPPESTFNATLNSVEALAASCPCLQYLSIYVDTDQSHPDAARDLDAISPYSPFQSLIELNLGSSGLRKKDARIISRWLSAICPNEETTIISVPSSSRHRDDTVEVTALFAAATERWSALVPKLKDWRAHNSLIANAASSHAAAEAQEELDLLRAQLRSLREIG